MTAMIRNFSLVRADKSTESIEVRVTGPFFPSKKLGMEQFHCCYVYVSFYKEHECYGWDAIQAVSRALGFADMLLGTLLHRNPGATLEWDGYGKPYEPAIDGIWRSAAAMDYESEVEEIFTGEMVEKARAHALDRAQGDIAQLDAATNAEKRFYALPDATNGYFLLGNSAAAQVLAEESLSVITQFEGNWNCGNAVHVAHTVLGLIALQLSDEDRAISELRQSAAIGGSPQLNSFGPKMSLARALLERGRPEEVLDYFEQCRSFWALGGKWLDVWASIVKAGRLPNFFQHRF